MCEYYFFNCSIKYYYSVFALVKFQHSKHLTLMNSEGQAAFIPMKNDMYVRCILSAMQAQSPLSFFFFLPRTFVMRWRSVAKHKFTEASRVPWPALGYWRVLCKLLLRHHNINRNVFEALPFYLLLRGRVLLAWLQLVSFTSYVVYVLTLSRLQSTGTDFLWLALLVLEL